ncbi:hypothetical protein [Halalkalibacter hemicellulosilyticus]|uniref:LysM domain-containing protein n=1 Tax=Halalkalibacter hemicellulosilyticusJCM 9152 TaxID=1236971 RepID=W4QGD3_9BACI|nr:hypothetical protein [Halalkalibacter hemicellulosilyticus]GAE30713.1 hypothetical protein JCM9152_2129 [Halalkalibacter hemicellulosilyticusJCM 9152]
MKRLLAFIFIFIFLYSTYYDLTIGTLPNGLSQRDQLEELSTETKNNEVPTKEVITSNDEPYEVIQVEHGQTVLSIVEHLHTGPIPATIQEIIFDFKQLNGIEPEEMQVGHEYLFPIYP